MPGPVSDSYEGPTDSPKPIPWRFCFSKFRKDGWPICPKCDEDELWSPFIPSPPDFTAGTLDEYVAAGLRCYRCDYEFPPRG